MKSPNLTDIELITTDYCQIKARARTTATLFELRTYDWKNLREAALVPPSSYVELTSIRSKGRHHSTFANKWQDLGHLRFLPADLEFESRWQANQQYSICCAFDRHQTSKFNLHIGDDRLHNAYDMHNQQLANLLKRAWQEIENPGLVSEVILESLGLAIIETLSSEFSISHKNNSPRIRGSQLNAQQRDRIIAKIRESRRSPRLKDLAAEIGVSERHFNRLFHSSTGSSISEIYQRERFNRARKLLTDSSLLIKEVAYQCGFNNSASFCKAFRVTTGNTPQEYRNSEIKSE